MRYLKPNLSINSIFTTVCFRTEMRAAIPLPEEMTAEGMCWKTTVADLLSSGCGAYSVLDMSNRM